MVLFHKESLQNTALENLARKSSLIPECPARNILYLQNSDSLIENRLGVSVIVAAG